jgi:ABC-type transport system involved in cytochrome bd biosynthesis fused ATPase/permease subunit
MIGTLRRLLALAPVPVGRASLAVGLGALAMVFGVGLMTTAGYLVTRAAEQPAILSLTTVIVAVRFFGLARPLARYLERLASHDVVLRVLGRLRARFYSRVEPLAPGELEAYRRGDLLDRMVGDVDALQALYLPGLAAPLVAGLVGATSVGVAAAIVPLTAVVLAAGLALGAVAVPLVSARLARQAARRQAAAAHPSWS